MTDIWMAISTPKAKEYPTTKDVPEIQYVMIYYSSDGIWLDNVWMDQIN